MNAINIAKALIDGLFILYCRRSSELSQAIHECAHCRGKQAVPYECLLTVSCEPVLCDNSACALLTPRRRRLFDVSPFGRWIVVGERPGDGYGARGGLVGVHSYSWGPPSRRGYR